MFPHTSTNKVIDRISPKSLNKGITKPKFKSDTVTFNMTSRACDATNSVH